jgi:hypothetical protein
LSRFQDDANDPTQITLSALYAQWVARYGAATVSNWIDPGAAQDPRTILELYQQFFTQVGAGTFNSVSYWDTMSHGSVDVSGTQVFPCQLDITSADALGMGLSGYQYQEALFKRAKAALAQQHGVDWKDFYAVALSFQSPDYGDQGGCFDGGPGVFSDIRYVRTNGMESWGQEMGHAFGLDHSRREGSDVDYQDPWDIMSTGAAYAWTPDPNYGRRGIGLNAWNMKSRQWLDEGRIWKPAGPFVSFRESVTLRPLHRRDLPGYLGAEVPGIGGDSPYLIEYRVPEAWDANIPEPVILVHRFEGQVNQFLGTHSYLAKGTSGKIFLTQGDVFDRLGAASGFRIEVQAMDAANATADVTLNWVHQPYPWFEVKPIPWWEWNPEKIRELFPGLSYAEFRRVTQQLDSAYAHDLLMAAGIIAPREVVAGVVVRTVAIDGW